MINRPDPSTSNIIDFATAAEIAIEPAPTAMDRYWLVGLSLVLVGWAGVAYFVFTSMGWLGRGLAFGALAVAAAATLAVVRGGAVRESPVLVAAQPEQYEQRRAA